MVKHEPKTSEEEDEEHYSGEQVIN